MFKKSALVALAGASLFSSSLYPVLAADDIKVEGPGNWMMKWNRNISVDKPGFLFLPKELPDTLVINSFEATPFFGKDYVSVANVSEVDPKVQTLTTSIDWPNYATVVDKEVFGFQALIIGAGFLVPSHATGGVYILEASPSPKTLKKPVKVTKDEGGYFYHRGVLRDMNGDGKLDIVTARCHYEVYPWSKKSGELVWLEQPATDALSGTPWTMHKLHDGPDFLFTPHPTLFEKNMLTVSAEYVYSKVAIYFLNDEGVVEERVIDDKCGHGFSASWVDLNRDGKLDLLATNHENQNGSVFAYTWDGDITKSDTKITKHVLATGFSAISTSQGTAAPGDAVAFHPNAETERTDKPWIFVSGDNGNTIVLLRPTSENGDDWAYSKQILAYMGADVGQNVIDTTSAVRSVYVPAYDNNEVVQYMFTQA